MHVNSTGNRPQWPAVVRFGAAVAQRPAVRDVMPAQGSNVAALPGVSLGRDLVRFAGRESDAAILERYKKNFGLDADTIEVRAISERSQAAADQLSRREIKKLVVQGLRVYEHALKNAKAQNFSNRYFSSSMQFETGRWSMATNIEHSGDCIYCGERSAIVRLWNDELEKNDLADFEDPQKLAALKDQLKVKNLVMSSASGFYAESNTGSPCSDCSHMMNTGRYFTPETRVSLICRDPESGEFYLGMKLLGEVLPMMGKQQPSLTDKPVDTLPVQFSERARKLLGEAADPDYPDMIRNLMQEARADYEKDDPVPALAEARVAAAIQLDSRDGNSFTKPGERFDYTMRWNIPSEEVATLLGYYQSADADNQGNLKVGAIAYYGNDASQVPTISSLGRISQFRGSGNTLIAVIEDDVIQVRTIYDYMPYLYISSTTRQKPKT